MSTTGCVLKEMLPPWPKRKAFHSRGVHTEIPPDHAAPPSSPVAALGALLLPQLLNLTSNAQRVGTNSATKKIAFSESHRDDVLGNTGFSPARLRPAPSWWRRHTLWCNNASCFCEAPFNLRQDRCARAVACAAESGESRKSKECQRDLGNPDLLCSPAC